MHWLCVCLYSSLPYLHWSTKCTFQPRCTAMEAQLCVLATTPLSLILGVWLLLKRTSIRLGEFPFWKSVLKLRCCVFDALIKKSHFICIINATEMKRREGKTALNVQRNTKSLFFFICLLLRRWPRCVCRFSERGVMAGGGGCLNRSCENTPCNNLSKQLASWTKEPTRSFWTTQRAAKIFATPFIFAAVFSQTLEISSPPWANRTGSEWGD